jgi:uncharacterized protein (TIGR03435 family)
MPEYRTHHTQWRHSHGSRTVEGNGRAHVPAGEPTRGVVGRNVVDKTGLQSKYDFVVDWQPDSPTIGQEPPATSDAPAVSVFTAVREGLGLRLKAATGPVDYIVIDKLEKPDEN